MLVAYEQQDMAKLKQLFGKTEKYSKYWEQMVKVRNKNIAASLVKNLKKQSAFAVVPVMNLDGIIRELQKKGYTVTPVISRSAPLIKPEVFDWQTYKDPDNRFSAEFPGEVKTKEKTEEADNGKPFKIESISWTSKKDPKTFSMSIMISEIPEGKSADDIFNQSGKQNGVEMEPVTLNGIKAMKIRMNFMAGVRMEGYFIEASNGKSVYMVMMAFPDNPQAAETAERFANSFKQLQ